MKHITLQPAKLLDDEEVIAVFAFTKKDLKILDSGFSRLKITPMRNMGYTEEEMQALGELVLTIDRLV